MAEFYVFMEGYHRMSGRWTKFERFNGAKKYLTKEHFVVKRHMEIEPLIDLMWSDPEDIDNWAVSPRGAGWLFGKKVTLEVNLYFVINDSFVKSTN